MQKLKMLVAAVVISLFAAGVVMADVINVSSSTVATIVPANGTVRNVSIFNDSTSTLYLATASSSATVAGGFPVFSSTTVQVYDLKGGVYGKMAAAAATAAIRTLPVKQ